MGNRKKIKDNRLRLKKERRGFFGRGIAKVDKATDPKNRDDAPPTHDELFEGYINEDGDELLKIVPAKANGIEVGIAYMWDDGSISVKLDENADPEALALIKATEQEVGYSLEEGRPFLIGETGGPDGPPKED
jgi:hypothetical protein